MKIFSLILAIALISQITGPPRSLSDLCVSVSVNSALSSSLSFSKTPQTQIPDWCKNLPHPEYKSLEKIKASDPWFEVYKVAPNTFAIYEPHQSEETIGYLILGEKRALLFDTGMGISDIRKIVTELTKLPVIILNSHTHDDHVGGNWQFDTVYSMDTDFSRANAKGSRTDAQEEIGPGQICGNLPQNFDAKSYETKPWRIAKYIHDGDKLDLGNRAIEIIATPGHTPDAISLLDRVNGLLFTGDTYYPGEIWLYRPETNLDDYVASVKRLAVLAPQLKLVLGAHNVPVANPNVLPKLTAAIGTVRTGKISGKVLDAHKSIYTVGEISFLLRSGAVGVH